MSELVKKSTADFIRPSAKELSSAFLAGLMKISMGGSSASDDISTASATSASGVIHFLWVKPFWMDSLCLLATLLKASTTSSIGALASNPVIGGNVVFVAVDVVVVVVVVEAVVVVVVAVDMAIVVEAKKGGEGVGLVVGHISLGDFFYCSKTLCKSLEIPKTKYVFTPNFRQILQVIQWNFLKTEIRRKN